MGGKSSNVPENKEKGGPLNQPPAFLPVEFLAGDGENQDHHGKKKKQVAELMHHDAFGFSVRLDCKGRIRKKQKKKDGGQAGLKKLLNLGLTPIKRGFA
jgi:hypothetical protein